MAAYKSLYGLRNNRGLISKNDSYLVYTDAIKAIEKANQLTKGMGIDIQPTDLFDYFKEYRGFSGTPEEFYERVEERGITVNFKEELQGLTYIKK